MKAAFDVWQAAVAEYQADPNNKTKLETVRTTGKQYRMLNSAWVSGNGAVSVGNSADSMTRQIINVAAGSEDTDAVNVAQLKAVNTKVDDNKISYVSINTKRDANKDNDQAGIADNTFSKDSAVIGSNTITTGLGNWNLIATGFGNTIKNISYDATTDSVTEKLVHNTYVYGNENTASNGIVIGRRNEITGDNDFNNIAIGFRNKNYGNRSINIGISTLTNGVDSIAVGFSAKAPVTDAISVGSAAQANGVGSMAFGSGAVASVDRGVALGYKSLANRRAGSIGYFTTLGSTERAAIAEKLGKTAEYNQLVATIDSYSDLQAKERQYRSYISERQKNEDLLNAEKANLSKYTEGSADYNASLAKIKEYQRLIKENNDGENSLSSIISSTDPDYKKLTQARTALKNMFAAYMSTDSAVSVGNPREGIYRQITGVAAGSEDTDAVNVAQLKDVGAAGLNFKGDGDTVVHRDLADTLNITGGNTDTDSLTEGNIGVVADDTTGTLSVKLAKNLTGLSNVKLGDVVTLDASGLTITGGPSVTTTGINAGDKKITNVANGENDTDAVNMSQLEALDTKVDAGATHYFSVNSDDSAEPADTNWNNDGATGANSIAIGRNASTIGTGSIAIGDGAKIFNVNSQYALVIGENAESAHGSIVIGRKAKDYDTDPAEAGSGIYIGEEAKSFGGVAQVVLGNYGQVKGQGSVAIGNWSKALAFQSSAVGEDAKALGEGASAFGAGSIAEFDNSSALGAYTNGRGYQSLSVGRTNVAAGNNSVAIGYQSFAHNGYIDEDAYKALSPEEQEKYFEASGLNAYFLKDTSDGTDWRKIGETYLNTAVGAYSRAYKQGATFGGMTSAQEQGTAIGTYAKANAKGAASLGYQSRANVENGVALGAYSVADREKGVIGYALGGDNSTLEKALESVGQKARYDELTNIIDPLKDEYNGLINAYYAATTTAEQTEAANKINAWVAEHSEFLPAAREKRQMIDSWQSGSGAVSVGSAGATRQITNVAAGSEDTDAVNVAQLKAVGSAGLHFKGDGDNVVHRELGDTLNVVGGNTDSTSLTEGNIGVVADDTTGILNVKLAKDLTELNSVKVGDAVTINASGLTVAAGGPSVTTTGINAGGKKITNVAKGVDDADAVNMEQFKALNTKVDTNKISYFSVKSTKAGNQDNTGATGSDSIAVGPNASATGDASIALGNDVTVTGSNAIGIGSSIHRSTNVVKAGSSFATSVGFLSSVDAKSAYGTAVGAQSRIANSPDATVVGSHADVTNSKMASAFGQNVSIFYSDFSGAVGSMTSVDTSKNAIVVGTGESIRQSIEGSDNGILIGSGDSMVVDSKGGIAIGNTSKVDTSTGAVSIGDKATTFFSPFGVAVGAGTVVEAEGAVALGADSTAYIAKGKVGYNPSSEALTDAEKESIAWKSTMGAVSIGVTTNTGSTTGTRQIVGVAAGSQDTDAVNVAQLKQVAEAATEAGKTTLKFTGDDTTAEISRGNGQTLNITGGAEVFTTDDNIGVVKDGDNALKVKLAKNLTMGDGSITFNNVILSSTGLNNGGNKITNVADGTEDTDIVNLKQLKGSTIKSSEVKYTDTGVGTITLTMQDNNKVVIKDLQDKYIKAAKLENNKLTLTRNDDEEIEVDKIASTDDIVGVNSKVNLKFTGDDTTDDAAITKKNGETLNILGGADKAKLTDNNIGVVSDNGVLKIKLAKDLTGIDSARIGGTLKDGVVTGGIYIANQTVKYSKDGVDDETGNFITGLTNTAWDPDNKGIVSGRAATEDQLKSVYDSISSDVKANKVVGGKNIVVTELPNGAGTEVALSDDLSFGNKDGNNVAIKGNDGTISAGDGGSNKVVIDGTNSTVTAGTGNNQVRVDGSKGQLTIGEAGNGLVMGNQDVAVKNADGTDKVDAEGKPVTENGKFITGLDNTKWDPEKSGYVPDRAATEGQLKDVADSVKGITDTIGVGTRDFAGDSGEAKVKLGESLNLKGGADVNKLSDGNIGVVGNGSNGLDIKLAKDLKGLDSVETKELTVTEKANIGNVSISNDNVTIGTGDSQTVITNEKVTTGSVTTGNTTINNDGLTVKNEDPSKNITINNNNVNMGGNVIHNVGEATEATDAINKGQFDRTISAIGTGMNQLNSRIGKLDSRVNRVGAGAAALAALHPLEYSSDSKWEVTAGVGNYKGANAIALGAFYRPNYDTMVSIGSSYGGGENMVNAGVTWRIGEGETGIYPSKQAMAQRINNLESALSQQHEQIEAQNQKIEELMAAMAEMSKNK
ncbi:hypothetical protein A0U42_08500 [Megasphaera sp. DISK 18]|nr:hypothetical protein A0U42_08500 [Megasphaera sp. DISK 18]